MQARLAEGAGFKRSDKYRVYPDDPKMSVVWEEANRRELAVLTLSIAQVPVESLAKTLVIPADSRNWSEPIRA
jgi:hypothetical protein